MRYSLKSGNEQRYGHGITNMQHPHGEILLGVRNMWN